MQGSSSGRNGPHTGTNKARALDSVAWETIHGEERDVGSELRSRCSSSCMQPAATLQCRAVLRCAVACGGDPGHPVPVPVICQRMMQYLDT